jgi:two-component system CheB/CheR fusion protein
MPVRQVQNRMRVEPNEIYVIPPNVQMTLEQGLLHLAPRHKIQGSYLPGDTFFESLASDRATKRSPLCCRVRMETEGKAETDQKIDRSSAIEPVAVITITDTGQGISADILPHIFDRFRQGDSSTTKAHSGLGLGLAIVRHLVELHGGTVQAESPGEGKGATFIVRLPLLEMSQERILSNESEPTVLNAAVNDSSQPLPDLTGLSILVVDDETDNRDLCKFVLESNGAEVLTVASAREALSALSEDPNRFNVLICDIGMPEDDGYWLIRQVRSLSAEAAGQTPAIALTAYAGEAEQQQAIEAGFQTHAAKPIEPVQLVLLVAELAERPEKTSSQD